MALQVSNFIKGRIGNLVYQNFRGKPGVRALGDTSKRTIGSKMSSQRFGTGQRCGAALRKGLALAIPFPKDKSLQGYFGGAITRWIAVTGEAVPAPQTHLAFLQGFAFNSLTNISDRWKVPLEFSQPSLTSYRLFITEFIPEEKLAAPANTRKVLCTIAAATCSIPNGHLTGSDHFCYEIPYTNEPVAEQFLDFSLPLDAGSLVLAVVRLQYILQNGRETNNKKFMPSSVVDARFV